MRALDYLSRRATLGRLPFDLPELLSALEALPRRAVLGDHPLARLWQGSPGVRSLPADSFERGRRPELRYDVIMARPPQSAAELAAACASARVVVLELATAACEALLRELPANRLLARAAHGGDWLGNLGTGDVQFLLLRGDLDWPLIRIDDYPTGVRPFPSDLSPIHRVLESFEVRSLPYHLGIVPGILNETMFEFLTQLRCMVPAQHGYDHAYPRMSARLLKKRDPWNERATVGTFNEFRFARYASIERKLRLGKTLLEERLKLPVSVYIPPCNVCDRATAKALAALGFGLCLSDRPVPGDHLPVLASDFYGRSNQLPLRPDMEVLCLHTNWEWDLQRAGNHSALGSFLDEVTALHVHKQQAIERLSRVLRGQSV